LKTARSGKEVREQVKKQYYDLILMDVGLPDSDGLTLTKEIRNNTGKNQKTLIVVLSGHLLNEQREEYLENGADEILQKPLDEQLLMQFLASKTL
jgi:two-component system sensor histidine kinase BarA